MNNDEIKTELTTVYNIISSLSVAGDAVDAIAAARAKLRRVIQGVETPGDGKEVTDG